MTCNATGQTLPRRIFVRGAATAAMAAYLPAARAVSSPRPTGLAFAVMRHDSAIGTHTVRFENRGTTLLAHIDCTLRIAFGPITLFRYHHHGVERWENGQFTALDTTTDNNGTPFSVNARRTPAGIEIRAGGTTRIAPPGALPLTHWNEACMSATLFNPQDGTPLKETAQFQGHDEVLLADGRRVAAAHYAMQGAAPIEDWYDTARTWTALRAHVKDGSVLEYRRT
jgi:hypothetical protein